MCVLSIKVPIRKKSVNLFNDPRINIHFVCLVWFLCFMAYQSLWVTSCKGHHCRRTAGILFNP